MPKTPQDPGPKTPPARDGTSAARTRMGLIVTLVTLGGLLLVWPLVQPAPPRTIRLGTGPEDGAYHAFGKRYAERLAEQGLTLELTSSAGSLENLRRLDQGEVDVAFVQGGSMVEALDASALEALGSLYHEPLWIFHRSTLEVGHLTDLAGRRVAVGGEGSGTAAVARTLLAANGATASTWVDLGGMAAAEALLAGEVDAACFVASARAQAIQRLAARDGEEVMLLSMTRAPAYTRLWPYLAQVDLPRGVLDLERDRPDRDIDLVAPLATLVARADLHPALVPVLLTVAREVHGGGGLFEDMGAFPSPQYLELPAADAAARWYEDGTSFLYRVLPFGVAAVVDRLKILLLPLLTLLFPLLKVAPPVYRWRIRSRIYRWYRVIRGIEQRFAASPDQQSSTKALAALAKVEGEINGVEVPASYMEELYNLRMHLSLVRQVVVTGTDSST